jgi:hypothetical protein
MQTHNKTKTGPELARKGDQLNFCLALGGPIPSAPRLDDQIVDSKIIDCIKNGSNLGGLRVKNRPNRGLTGRGVKNTMFLAELNRTFPEVPYQKLYYRVKILAQSGRIWRCRVGGSVLLILPE